MKWISDSNFFDCWGNTRKKRRKAVQVYQKGYLIIKHFGTILILQLNLKLDIIRKI